MTKNLVFERVDEILRVAQDDKKTFYIGRRISFRALSS